MMRSAVDNHGLMFATFDAWFNVMLADLVAIFNGENDDPSDDFAYKYEGW